MPEATETAFPVRLEADYPEQSSRGLALPGALLFFPKVLALLPHVLVKGGDWQPDQMVGREAVESHGGRVVSVPLVDGYSTTALVARLRGVHG